MSLTAEAATAYATILEQAAAAAEAERKALRQAALDAVKAVLVRPDSSTLTMTDAGLSVTHTDLANGLVVVGDGQTHLAAQLREDRWVVAVVRGSGADWTKVGDRVRNLADVGAVLAAG